MHSPIRNIQTKVVIQDPSNLRQKWTEEMNERIQTGRELMPLDRHLLNLRHSPVATIGMSVLDKNESYPNKGVPINNQDF